MKFNILTIFPEVINSYCNTSILKNAQNESLIEINAINIREYTEDKHNTVDDRPYGGGPGMVMKPAPIYKALSENGSLKIQKDKRSLLMSPRGEEFTQEKAEQYSDLDEITLVCGRYEGVDQRVADHMVDDELSIGSYILAGGELPALVVTEAVSRLVSGVLGNPDSLNEETYGSEDIEKDEYPQYTRPAEFKDWGVPKVLLSGNHKKIKEWRKKHSK
jgi:tRNA (guanine37-N1)-methyltransferase